MSRPVALSLLTLGVVLFLFPLTLPKPGLPATLKADGPAYLLAAKICGTQSRRRSNAGRSK